VLCDLRSRLVADLSTQAQRLFQIAVGGGRVLGSKRERPELVPRPRHPGPVAEGLRRLERHPDGLDERHPTHEQRQEARQGSSESKDVAVPTLPVESLQLAQQSIDLFQDDLPVDPARGDGREELERPLDSACDAGGLAERLLGRCERVRRAGLG
jgi:hypothetical protein